MVRGTAVRGPLKKEPYLATARVAQNRSVQGQIRDILSQTRTKLTFRVPAGLQLISLSLHSLTSERDTVIGFIQCCSLYGCICAGKF